MITMTFTFSNPAEAQQALARFYPNPAPIAFEQPDAPAPNPAPSAEPTPEAPKAPPAKRTKRAAEPTPTPAPAPAPTAPPDDCDTTGGLFEDPTESATPATPAITYEQVAAAVVKAMKSSNRAAVVAAARKYKVGSARELKPEQWAGFLKEIS